MPPSQPDKPKSPEPIRNPTPKQRYMMNVTFLKDHHAILDHPGFDRACDYALLQYQRQLTSNTSDAITASAAGFRMQGAMEFLMVLKNLGDSSPVPTRRPDDNLQH